LASKFHGAAGNAPCGRSVLPVLALALRAPVFELLTLERRRIATQQGVESRHEIIQVCLQGETAQLLRARPASPVPNAVSGDSARNVTDEGQPLDHLRIRNVTFQLRRGALSIGPLPGGGAFVGPVPRHFPDVNISAAPPRLNRPFGKVSPVFASKSKDGSAADACARGGWGINISRTHLNGRM
jgi:hypothetical protein